MIKKLKIGLLVAVLSLALSGSSANAAPVNFDKDTNVTVSSRSYYILNGSGATSFTVNAGTFVVTVPVSSTLTFVSNSRDTLVVTSGPGSVACNLANSTVTITGAGTVTTITPSSTVCGPSGGGGAGGGGGGGGGSSSSSTTTTTTPATPATPAVPSVILGCNGKVGFSTVNGQSCAANTAPATPAVPATPATTVTVTAVTPTTTFTVTYYNLGNVTLKNGSKGNDVKELQKILNKILKMNLALDGKLGPKTIAVIKTWQKNNGLVADGLVGAKTKAKMKAEAEK